MPTSAHFLRTLAEKKGVRMSAVKKGLKVSLPSAPSPASESGTKRACHAVRTSLAHSTPRMLCVNTHYPTGPGGAKCPPRSASPTVFAGSLRKPLETTATTRSRAKIQAWQQFSTHFNVLSGATIGSLMCSSHNSSRVLFLPRMFSLRSGS